MTPAPGIDESDVLALFPSLVWQMRCAAPVREAIEDEAERALDALRPGWRTLGPGRGWQSDPDLQARPDLGRLRAGVLAAAERVLRFLHVAADPLQMTGCWLNVNAAGTGHPVHTHPNNYLSGVYYVRAPAGADTVCFHDPRPQAGAIRPRVSELTSANADLAAVRVSPGTLLLFPAFLPHSVPPSRADAPRVSVSFNLMFPRFAEQHAAPAWTGGAREGGSGCAP